MLRHACEATTLSRQYQAAPCYWKLEIRNWKLGYLKLEIGLCAVVGLCQLLRRDPMIRHFFNNTYAKACAVVDVCRNNIKVDRVATPVFQRAVQR